MQISLRSYLTAGVSLTAASAIALTPLAIPANERAITIPNVTVSDIQLTVTPAEIQAFFAELQLQLEAFNAGLAEVIALPGATLAGGLEIAIELNTEYFDTLKGLTTNPTLLDLLDALYLSSNYGLTSLQTAVVERTENVAITAEDLANLLASSITGSLSNVLSSFVAVLNNPLNTSAYAGLLSLGLVDTVQDLAANGVSAVQVLSDSGFGFIYTGLDLLDSQIFNAIDTVGALMDVGAEATGSQLVQAVNEAIQSITLAPALALNNAAFGLTEDILGGFQEGIDDVLGGAQALIGITGGSLQFAINAVGANPLNPENYLLAGGILLAGGFDGFNTTVSTVGSVAEIPFERGISITTGLASVVTGLNTNFAVAFSDVLAALGLPDDIVALPLALASTINEVIGAGTEAVVGGLELGEDIVANTTATIIEVSNQIEAAIFGVLPPVGAGATTLAVSSEEPALKVASEEPAGDPAGDAVAVSNESEDSSEEAPAEEAPAEEAPAEGSTEEDAPADDEATDDAPADDEASDDDAPADDDAADDDADSKSDYSSRSDDKKAEKAAAADKKSDSDSDSDSDSGSSDSGSDSGSDSE
jgi:hypothetical protein